MIQIASRRRRAGEAWRSRAFGWSLPAARKWNWGDTIALFIVAVLVYAGVRLAINAPSVIRGPEISLAPGYLALYAALSTSRMLAAYVLSIAFTLACGHVAANNDQAGRFLIPLLDVLQSVPILSFLPVVLLGLSAILKAEWAAEIASVVLIFTSQVWNLAFAWYQSLKTIPHEFTEVADIFQFRPWLRFKTIEFPFAAISLVWNSIMSWSGGWFFLMAAEIFTVGRRDFRLPGIGAYLSEAAARRDGRATLLGVMTLLFVIVLLDQFVWRPLLTWSDRFRLEMVESQNPPTSWVYNAWRRSRVVADFIKGILRLATIRADRAMDGLLIAATAREKSLKGNPVGTIVLAAFGGALLYGAYRAVVLLFAVSASEWMSIGAGLGATSLRVAVTMVVALVWTVPAGVLIAGNNKLTARLQPIIQIAASVPATALFPVILLGMIRLPAGLNIAAILVMLLGTQWYLLFNVIAGASAIPQDLKYTAALLRLGRWTRWRILVLPALFPYLITGLITAAGGAWNASILAEYVNLGGTARSVTGIGSLISLATANGNYPVLFAATLAMIVVVVATNRVLWRRLYEVAENRYRMD